MDRIIHNFPGVNPEINLHCLQTKGESGLKLIVFAKRAPQTRLSQMLYLLQKIHPFMQLIELSGYHNWRESSKILHVNRFRIYKIRFALAW
jgi:hypothetical protein